MGGSQAGDDGRVEDSGLSKTMVERVRGHLAEDSKGGWEKSWEEGITPWDIGSPTPVIVHLLQRGELPKGRTLVPGCGSGHDVVAMACPERFVVGLDISESAMKKACEVGDFAGGPPYAVSVSTYETVLNPLGFQAVSVMDNELAIESRKGKEKLVRWKRKSTQLPM